METEHKYILFSNSVDIFRFPVDSIVYVQADGNFSYLYTKDGKSHLLGFKLGEVEKIFSLQLSSDDNRFYRVGNSNIINLDYVTKVNLTVKKLVLSDCDKFSYTISPSKEALKLLRELVLRKEGF